MGLRRVSAARRVPTPLAGCSKNRVRPSEDPFRTSPLASQRLNSASGMLIMADQTPFEIA